MRRAYCSHTSFPNTPETDKLPEVEHTVHVKLDGGSEEKVRIMAREPEDAINRVNSLDDATYAALRRV